MQIWLTGPGYFICPGETIVYQHPYVTLKWLAMRVDATEVLIANHHLAESKLASLKVVKPEKALSFEHSRIKSSHTRWPKFTFNLGMAWKPQSCVPGITLHPKSARLVAGVSGIYGSCQKWEEFFPEGYVSLSTVTEPALMKAWRKAVFPLNGARARNTIHTQTSQFYWHSLWPT